MPSDIPAKWRAAVLVFLGVALSLCGGCAAGPDKADPFEKVNRFFYGFNDGLDRYALKPAADIYVKITPTPIRNAIGNGFENLTYFNVVANDILQGKKDRAYGDFWHFVLNSTFGIGGIFDIASATGLPAHDNDFGVTLGKWGVKPGPYLVVPFYGPYTLRDVTRPLFKDLCDPTTWLYLPWQISLPLEATDVIDTRSRYDSIVKFRNEAAVDPYVFTREAYLQYRQGLIDEGKPPQEQQQQNFYDEDMDNPPPTTKPTTRSAE
ncbi:MAG: VacJ family lipoprotein [Tepidisphaeraceae bacterium]|jgi:phospholipid-binding lipoprotein MlaA